MQTLRKEATARVVEFDVVAKVVALENEIMEIRFYYDDSMRNLDIDDLEPSLLPNNGDQIIIVSLEPNLT